MPNKKLDPKNLSPEEDWIGNNAAFKCPLCGNTFIVSGMLHRNGRKCTKCGRSIGYCKGGKDSGGSANIEW